MQRSLRRELKHSAGTVNSNSGQPQQNKIRVSDFLTGQAFSGGEIKNLSRDTHWGNTVKAAELPIPIQLFI